MPTVAPINAPAHRPYRFAPITIGGETANINATLAVEHGKIDGFYQGAQQETLTQAASQASQILAVGTSKYTALLADLDRRSHVAHDTFSTARATVTGIATTQAALARADAQAAVVRLREDCTRQRSEAVAGATAEGSRMRSAAKEGGVRILQSGRATRDIVQGHVNGALTTANSIEDADDKVAVTQALRSTSSSVREHLVDQGLADHDTLLEKAAGNEQKIVGEARGLFEQRDEKLAEVEQGMVSTGDQIAARIGHLHTQQMIAIAQAEHQFLSKVTQLKTSAAKIVETSGAAAKRLNAVAQAQVATLHIRHAGANAGLDRVAQAAAAKLGEKKLSPQGKIKGPVRRPVRGDGHSGDFVDGDGVDWDVKAPKSRGKIIEKATADAKAANRKPPNMSPDRPIRGEYNTSEILAEIKGELKAGENVIIDGEGLTPADLQALRTAVEADPALAGKVLFHE